MNFIANHYHTIILASSLVLNLVMLIIGVIILKRVHGIRYNLNLSVDHHSSKLEQIEQELIQQIRYNTSQLASNFEVRSDMQHQNLQLFANQINDLRKNSDNKLEHMRKTLEENLYRIQQHNHQQLEKMRATVEEKLQDTLEKRLGESFKIVSDRLEVVHKGIGEMQSLANGVGDLKRVLTNIKSRGTWGEVQLEALIDQMLAPDQFAKNIAVVPQSNNRVEFAIKLPGKQNENHIWLPIDAKFPLEDYQRLLEYQEQGIIDKVEVQQKLLENAIKLAAKTIMEKYIHPPDTTDFAIMFVPMEGIYAEVAKKPGLIEFLQREYRIIITSPTTLMAILNSLQLGFQTLAIEKRSSEVWKLLSIVKSEFLKFAQILSKTKTKLDQASKVIEEAESKTRNIQRKLTKVQLPQTLPIAEEIEEEEYSPINNAANS